jgi:2-oxo-4-hydroxy-4-carboxy--5-ureidoimidazoline (OHCU) decarboxylase
MTIWWLAFILGCLAAVMGGFVWVVLALNRLQQTRPGSTSGPASLSTPDLAQMYVSNVEKEVAQLFTNEFRETLREHGRQRFEKIIDDNALFLKQDLDMVASQLNDYMRQQMTAKLDTQFDAYGGAMKQAQDMALATLQKTATDVETQRVQLGEALQKGSSARETALLKIYEANMAKIVEHYVLQALGDQFDLKSQLPYIIAQMESNKQKIMEDMRL